MNTSVDAEWVVPYEGRLFLLFHPWLNAVCSWFGYALFALILYASVRARVFHKRMHDVILILFFAFVADLMEMRVNMFLVFNMERDKYDRGFKPLPTTISACTIGVWIFHYHFLTTYVDAIISIYRYVTRIVGKSLHVCYIYIGISIIFALQASLLFESILHGTPEEVVRHEMSWPVYCTKAYMLDGPLLISKIATALTMAIAPTLSAIIMFKKSKRSEKESGVTAFILISSFLMAFLVHTYLLMRYTDAGQHIPMKFKYILNTLMLIAIEIQYFRFPLLCLSAAIMVKDIRDAVLPFILRTGEPKPLIPQSSTNDNYIDDNLD